MKHFIRNKAAKSFIAASGMLICLFSFHSSIAASRDSSSTKVGNRLMLSLSGDLGTSVKKPLNGPWGYRAEIDYALGISRSTWFGFGVAYSGVPSEDVETYADYFDPIYTTIDNREVYNNIELPVFIQVNITHAAGVNFNFKFGGSVIKHIHSYYNVYITGNNPVIAADNLEHTEGSASYPLIVGSYSQPFKAAIFLAPGMDIKLSQKLFLGLSAIVSVYPSSYYAFPSSPTTLCMYGLQCSVSY